METKSGVGFQGLCLAGSKQDRCVCSSRKSATASDVKDAYLMCSQPKKVKVWVAR